jgi:phage terminase large subunit-like protein
VAETLTAEQLAELTSKWDPATRARAMESIRSRTGAERHRWYCQRGPSCDGRPHDGYEYKHARGDQWPPSLKKDWFVWFLMSGRGSGKTRSGSGWVYSITKYVGRIAGVARRGPDFRQTMIEGDSGLIKHCEFMGEKYGRDFFWEPSKKEFTFSNGSKFYGYSGEEPDTLRGPQHGAAWLDEPAHIPLIEDVWSNLLFGLRLPGLPGGARALLSSTPLPTKWVKAISKDPRTVLVRVNTEANIDNLDETYRRNVIDPLRGTRIGRQELSGEILEDVEGALWHNDMIQLANDFLVPAELWPTIGDFATGLDRVVVAIDPAGTANKKSDETGIVAAGRGGNEGFVLADKSGRMSPQGWARTAIGLYETLQADAIIVETNFGGDMVERNLRTDGFTGRVIQSRAVRGKQTRAEPVVALYEQGRIKHVPELKDLEDEMTTWVPEEGPSPNRVDAMVWAFTDLFHVQREGKVGSPATLSPAQPEFYVPGRSGIFA